MAVKKKSTTVLQPKRRATRKWKWLEWLDDAEIILIGLAVAIGMIIGPVWLARRWFLAGQTVPAAVLFLAWSLSLSLLIRDALRRQWSLYGRIILLLWFLLTIITSIVVLVVL